LLPYKGLDLLADALRILGPREDMLVRVVGKGPESSALTALRGLPGVTVENRWVPEIELGALIGWADLVVLPYREASQSGVASAALAMGRHVLSTRVGGLLQQLGEEKLATLCAPDPGAIAVALSGLLDVLRKARGSRSTDKANPAASWEAFAARVLAELRGLTALQPRRFG
jgi:glycosyltransferase involved in cell wall biosynthesis